MFLAASAASWVAMVAIDFLLGPRAEFLNAYSVVQRLAGRPPANDVSLVAQTIGPAGEFAVVVVANLAIGGIFTSVAKLLRER